MQNDLSLKIWTQWGNVLRIVLNQMHEELNKVHRVSLRTSISLVTMNSDNKDHPQFGKNSNRQPNAKYNVLESVSWKSRKAIPKTTTYLFFKAGLLVCCKKNKN